MSASTSTSATGNWLIKNALDASSTDEQCIDVRITAGIISDVSNVSDAVAATSENSADDVRSIDATNLFISPGFIDSYARLRDPGFEKKATIASEARAAALNGITTLVCSPDTDPVIDEAATVELINRKARDCAHAKVLPLAALTRGLQGELLSELATLKAAGCIGASNADRPLTDIQVIRRCMDYARTFDMVLVINPADRWLTANGCAHEGATATRLGLPTIPVAAETVALAILIELAWQTGARIHFSRITSRRGSEMIRQAKQGGLNISADTSINHLMYDDTMLEDFDSQYRTVAPLRDKGDRDALREAVSDGSIDGICTDHAPHEPDAKLAPFPSAEPGISGLDSLLPLLLQLQQDAGIPLPTLIKAVTANPASVFGLRQGLLEPGRPADLILFDQSTERLIDAASMHSAGSNTPQRGQKMRGLVHHTLIDGRRIERD